MTKIWEVELDQGSNNGNILLSRERTVASNFIEAGRKAERRWKGCRRRVVAVKLVAEA